MKKENITNLSTDQQFIHQLLLRSSSIKDIGLYNGKMGLILFFSHYFKIDGNPVFEDTADELMDELMEDLYQSLPAGFAAGLSGIGWGVEYLIQNNFIDGDSLDVCEEVDKKIMETDPVRITDFSIETGLEGILHYVLAHIKGVSAQHGKTPFDEKYLTDLNHALLNIPKESNLTESFKILSQKYLSFYKNRKELDYTLSLSFIIENNEIENPIESAKSVSSAFHQSLGLNKGLSGYLLKNLLTPRL